MQENLVIVESPAKAKTIEKFLGKGYVVKSSFGHIRDLSKKEFLLGISEAPQKSNLCGSFSPSTWDRCHAMASPSRSSSDASQTVPASLASFSNSATVFFLSGDIS